MLKKPYMKFIIVILLLVAVNKIYKYIDHSQEEKRMEAYLEERYGKEFEVKVTGYYRRSIGAQKELTAQGYPKEDKTLLFDVRKFVDGSLYGRGNPYFEDYLKVLWVRQSREKMKTIIQDELFYSDIGYHVENVREKMVGKTLDLEEAVSQYKGQIRHHVSWGIFKPKDFKDISEEDLAMIYSVINKMKDPNYKVVRLYINFWDERYREMVQSNPQAYLDASTVEASVLRKKGAFLPLRITIEDVNKIEKLEDILEYLPKR